MFNRQISFKLFFLRIHRDKKYTLIYLCSIRLKSKNPVLKFQIQLQKSYRIVKIGWKMLQKLSLWINQKMFVLLQIIFLTIEAQLQLKNWIKLHCKIIKMLYLVLTNQKNKNSTRIFKAHSVKMTLKVPKNRVRFYYESNG